jgi:bifunctional DNA-binding transcriptional regulator/antitoxin component of YhaV-PrlF toxin-antitoxin module
MEERTDPRGRLTVPKSIRHRVGLSPGTVVSLSEFGDELRVGRSGRTAQLLRRNGRLVAKSETQITDHDVARLVDSVRL